MPQNTPKPVGGLTAYVNIDGAAEASAFYQRAFGASEQMRLPDKDGKRLLHCQLRINGGDLLISDIFPEMGMSREAPANLTLHLQVDDIDAWWKRAADAGATVVSPVQQMFWGDRYGVLKDPFGVQWSMGQTVAEFQPPKWD
ncbi:VOC family protein [Phenylobacterium sp.]|uniref:VOC family protein n=1 Tax=Phenylobacterium sp. TaxID=1871053 RepID=UPI0035AF224F